MEPSVRDKYRHNRFLHTKHTQTLTQNGWFSVVFAEAHGKHAMLLDGR